MSDSQTTARRGMAAVGLIRSRLVAARRPPTISDATVSAAKEAAEALGDIRELESSAPGLSKGPRPEGRPSDTDSASSSPTAASDAAHLSWQLQRCLLYLRRRALPGSNLLAQMDEPAVCNVVCGAALVQSAVDSVGQADSSWQLEVLASLGISSPDAMQRAAVGKLIDVARGAAPPPPLGMARPMGPGIGSLLPFKDWLGDRTSMEAVAARIGADATQLMEFASSLPRGVASPPPFTATLRTLARVPAITTADLAKLRKRPVDYQLTEVVGLVNTIRFQNGFVAVVQSVTGRPLAVAPTPCPTSQAAGFQCMAELERTRPEWLNGLPPRSFVSLRSHDLSRFACVATSAPPKLARVCEPMYATKNCIESLVHLIKTRYEPDGTPERREFELVLLLAGEYSDYREGVAV